MDEHLYIVAYDIADPKRWRRVFRVMKGYGDWLQLSVFQCRMGERRRAELIHFLDNIIHHGEDHIVILDLGPAERVLPRVTSLGKTYTEVVREAIVV
ncbi:MAG: CRISPR-associated endonuclease Cas2 [Burkholderiales bacterium]|nr:CRISPR-associated endonuclease Cas2 [Burkholderiales bacterium]